eukprot:9502200-Pyramimonas_sp.AAC.1
MATSRSPQNVKKGPTRSRAARDTLPAALQASSRPPEAPAGLEDPTPLRGPANKTRETQTRNSAEQRRGTGKTWKSHNSFFFFKLGP